MLGHNFNKFDVKNKNRVLRNLLKLRITITQVRTRSEPARPTGTHPLKTISKTGNCPSVTHCPNLIAVSGNKISTIELAIISEPHAVAPLWLRSGSGDVGDNFDAGLRHA